MKKMLLFAGVIILLFVGLALVVNYSNKEDVKGNPYGLDTLHQATIDELDDPLYQNLILPDELEQKIANKETFTIYYYKSDCPHCKVTSPIIVPMAEDMGIDLKEFNLLEFPDGWAKYNIEGTPTVVHYVDGKEQSRIVGEHPKEDFQAFFNKIK